MVSGFYFFFLNSDLLHNFDKDFIVTAISLRLFGTSHDALNAVNQIYSNTGAIDYPFKSIFYPLGFVYSYFINNFFRRWWLA
jgi:hypothetical protein